MKTNLQHSPRLLLGFAAWPDGGTGYVNGSALNSVIMQIKAEDKARFGD